MLVHDWNHTLHYVRHRDHCIAHHTHRYHHHSPRKSTSWKRDSSSQRKKCMPQRGSQTTKITMHCSSRHQEASHPDHTELITRNQRRRSHPRDPTTKPKPQRLWPQQLPHQGRRRQRQRRQLAMAIRRPTSLVCVTVQLGGSWDPWTQTRGGSRRWQGISSLPK